MFSFDFRKTPAWDYQRPLLRLNPTDTVPFHLGTCSVRCGHRLRHVGSDYGKTKNAAHIRTELPHTSNRIRCPHRPEYAIRPRAGEIILVTGAIGGVGRTAVHVAKQHGAHVIAGVRGSQRAEAERLGADRVIALGDVNEVGSLPELDAVADMVGHDSIDRILLHIRRNGVLATVLGAPPAAEGRDLRVVPIWAEPDSVRLEELGREVARGLFSIPIGKRLRLSQIRESQQLAENGASGK